MATRSELLGSATYDIYTGFWIDWSRGRVFGSTITLTSRNGAMLVAFLALFVSFVGTSVWQIVCFGLHHYYSQESSQDALYHQRQAILRNSANGTSGTWSLLQVLWAWNKAKAARRLYQRILPLLGLAICCICAAGVAGTFSSRVTTAMGNNVLLANPNCTKATNNSRTLSGNVRLVLAHMNEQGAQWNNWAERCYTNSTSYGNCKQFVKDRLQPTITRNASCPFPGNICHTVNDRGSIVLDTGFLNSHNDFGINAPADERILYRQLTSCAPLVVEGYQEESSTDGEVRVMNYFYGNSSESANYTTYYPILNVTTAEVNGLNVYPRDYTINFVLAFAVNGTAGGPMSMFTPIPELQVPDADISIIFLSGNGVIFLGEVNDPWYSAHVDTKFADNAASPLACATQYQACNPNLPEASRCTPLSGMMDLQDRATQLWTDPRHLDIWGAFNKIIQNSQTVTDVIDELGVTARRSKADVAQYSLPDDQWQRELEQWHATTLVSMQAAAVTAATQSQDAGWGPLVVPFDTSEEKNLCRNIASSPHHTRMFSGTDCHQKVYSSAHANFSVFGLCFILVVGSIIVMIASTLESIATWIQRRKNYDTYARLEWNSNQALQLQRMAHEELGLGTWSRCIEAVPVTKRGDRFGVLDISNRAHPTLKAPPVAFEELLAEPRAATSGSAQSSSPDSEPKSTTVVQQNDDPSGEMERN